MSRSGTEEQTGGEAKQPPEQRAESLRRELDVLLDELRARGKRAFDVRYQLQKHPAVVAGAGALVLVGVGFAVAQIVRRQRRKHSVKARLSALSALVQERAAAGLSAARTGRVGKRRRRRAKGETSVNSLVKAALAVAIPRLLPLVIGKLMKGADARAGLVRPLAAPAGNGQAGTPGVPR